MPRGASSTGGSAIPGAAGRARWPTSRAEPTIFEASRRRSASTSPASWRSAIRPGGISRSGSRPGTGCRRSLCSGPPIPSRCEASSPSQASPTCAPALQAVSAATRSRGSSGDRPAERGRPRRRVFADRAPPPRRPPATRLRSARLARADRTSRARTSAAAAKAGDDVDLEVVEGRRALRARRPGEYRLGSCRQGRSPGPRRAVTPVAGRIYITLSLEPYSLPEAPRPTDSVPIRYALFPKFRPLRVLGLGARELLPSPKAVLASLLQFSTANAVSCWCGARPRN